MTPTQKSMIVLSGLVLVVILIGGWHIGSANAQEHGLFSTMGNSDSKREGSRQDENDKALPTVSTFDSWDPFAEMERMQREINRLFRGAMQQSFRSFPYGPQHVGAQAVFEPQADFDETMTDYIIHMDLPGMRKDKIEVTVKEGYLTVSGERHKETETTKEFKGRSFYLAERSLGKFQRSMPVPGDIDETAISAEYKNGVLILTLPKKNPTPPEKVKRIQIK